MNGVIYGRYSSHGQTEASIEGQLKACYEYAAQNGITVIAEYIDRALTGTSDKRPQFQKMILDSAKRQFEVVFVYQLDRFARNRYDSATHKTKLKKNGVKVISVRENITDDASGVLMEAVLEGMAEYYSAELSQKVKRGIALSVEKCRYIGGFVPIGFLINEEKQYEVDPLTAPIVQKCFNLYASGYTFKQINDNITEQYGKSYFGNISNSIRRILLNRNYIGVYTRGGQEKQNGMPRIVSDELFERVQSIMIKNKKAPARARAHEEYLLTTKLYCGYDREMMVGVSGTSKSGAIYHYYTCKNVWNKKGCKKKNVKKNYIEDFILSKAREQLTDENIALIAEAVSEISKRESNGSTIAEIKKKLKANAAAVENLMIALEQGEHMELLSERITKKQAEKSELEKALAKEQMNSAEIDENEIKFFLNQLKAGKVDDIIYKRALIAIFINAVYLYDDHATIVFNASNKPVTLGYSLITEMEEKASNDGMDQCSYMECPAPDVIKNLQYIQKSDKIRLSRTEQTKGGI
jgi:DNA invertase Pin-like site-specific DNA recombinase